MEEYCHTYYSVNLFKYINSFYGFKLREYEIWTIGKILNTPILLRPKDCVVYKLNTKN